VVETDRARWEYSQRFLEQVVAILWRLPAVGYQQPSWYSDGAVGEGVSGVSGISGSTFTRTHGSRKPHEAAGAWQRSRRQAPMAHRLVLLRGISVLTRGLVQPARAQ
jgi:hypothetical protein